MESPVSDSMCVFGVAECGAPLWTTKSGIGLGGQIPQLRGSRYLAIKEYRPTIHKNHGLRSLVPQ